MALREKGLLVIASAPMAVKRLWKRIKRHRFRGHSTNDDRDAPVFTQVIASRSVLNRGLGLSELHLGRLLPYPLAKQISLKSD